MTCVLKVENFNCLWICRFQFLHTHDIIYIAHIFTLITSEIFDMLSKSIVLNVKMWPSVATCSKDCINKTYGCILQTFQHICLGEMPHLSTHLKIMVDIWQGIYQLCNLMGMFSCHWVVIGVFSQCNNFRFAS